MSRRCLIRLCMNWLNKINPFLIFSPAKDTNLWDLARKMRNSTIEKMDKKLHFVYGYIYDEFPWDSDLFAGLEKKNNGFSDTLNFSNIGAFQFKKDWNLCKPIFAKLQTRDYLSAFRYFT